MKKIIVEPMIHLPGFRKPKDSDRQEETAEEVSAVPEEPGEAAATDIPPETQPTEREPLENDISSRT